jgi:hypothetical protein
VFLLGIPCVLSQNAFNEFDYWAGTVALVVFALAEVILFAWIFGMDMGWKEITDGADIQVPVIFKYIIKFITPVFLLVVFIGSLPGIIENLTKPIDWYVVIARMLMLLLFIGIAVLVYIAHKNKTKNSF